MHTNHRRTVSRDPGFYKHGRRYWTNLKWLWKRFKNTERRAREREFIHHERWDELPTKYPKDILRDLL